MRVLHVPSVSQFMKREPQGENLTCKNCNGGRAEPAQINSLPEGNTATAPFLSPRHSAAQIGWLQERHQQRTRIQSPPVTVRLANAADAEALAALHGDLLCRSAAHGPLAKWVESRAAYWQSPAGVENTRARIVAATEDPANGFFRIMTAKDDPRRVLGYVEGQRTHEGSGQTLSAIGIVPEHWRNGLAPRLLESFMEWADPFQPIVLSIEESNTRAQVFFARHGFSFVSDVDRDYGPGKLVRMQRDPDPGHEARQVLGEDFDAGGFNDMLTQATNPDTGKVDQRHVCKWIRDQLLRKSGLLDGLVSGPTRFLGQGLDQVVFGDDSDSVHKLSFLTAATISAWNIFFGRAPGETPTNLIRQAEERVRTGREMHESLKNCMPVPNGDGAEPRGHVPEEEVELVPVEMPPQLVRYLLLAAGADRGRVTAAIQDRPYTIHTTYRRQEKIVREADALGFSEQSAIPEFDPELDETLRSVDAVLIRRRTAGQRLDENAFFSLYPESNLHEIHERARIDSAFRENLSDFLKQAVRWGNQTRNLVDVMGPNVDISRGAYRPFDVVPQANKSGLLDRIADQLRRFAAGEKLQAWELAQCTWGLNQIRIVNGMASLLGIDEQIQLFESDDPIFSTSCFQDLVQEVRNRRTDTTPHDSYVRVPRAPWSI